MLVVDEVVPDELGLDEEFLTAGQRQAYGRFEGSPSVEDLQRCFLLDDEDRRLVAKGRGDANRLGFPLQLTTVRYFRGGGGPAASPAGAAAGGEGAGAAGGARGAGGAYPVLADRG
jgi:hypothetical protein